MNDLLTKIKLALRIATTDFDAELTVLLNSCISQLRGLGITVVEPAQGQTYDPQIIDACVSYVKWKFGENDRANEWKEVFYTSVAQLKTMTNYTTWSNQ